MDMPTFLDAIRALGTAGGPVFAVLWWLERTDRKEAQKENQEGYKELLIQTLETTHRAASSVTSFTSAIDELKGAFTTSTERLTSLVRAIKRP